MRILVTGGSGFIGSFLVNRLVYDGHEVKILARKEVKVPNTITIVGDIRDPTIARKAVKDVDVVFHLAAAVSGKKIPTRTYWEVNVGGTKNLAKASAGKVKKFILCSTAKVLGPSTRPLNEDSSPNPRNIYERTKLEGEKVASKCFNGRNSHLVIIRPSFVYGPGGRPMYNLIRFVQKSKFIIAGKNLIQPLYVSDLVDALICSLKKRASGCYIVAGELVTMREFIKIIEIALKVKNKIYLPDFFIKPVKMLFPFLSLYLKLNITKEMLDAFENSYVYDTTKARNELGWKPTTSLREGIEKTVNWYRKERCLQFL